MAKLQDAGKQAVGSQWTGCVVQGRVALGTTGAPLVRSFKVEQRRSAHFRGVYYPAQTLQVQVGGDGGWSVLLAPSSAVGPYLVTIAGQRLELVVPDEARAEFGDVARALGTKH